MTRSGEPHDEMALASSELFRLNYAPDHAPEFVFEKHRAWAERYAAPHYPDQATFANDRNADRRLRVGYVSADFRRHPLFFFIEPVLRGHDRLTIETFCYSNCEDRDDLNLHLRRLCPNWRDVASWDDDRLAEKIREDRIDILVDLSGHTLGNRLLVFARRPAPVQVTGLGYVNTTGLQTMDYRLTDPWCDPGNHNDEFYSETLWRLPFGFDCYAPPAGLPDVGEPPCVTTGHVTFGSFNNLDKVPSVILDVWARILRRVPGSRLFIKDEAVAREAVRTMILKRFEAAGIAGERLLFGGRDATLKEHYDQFAKVDIALDTYPYNGTTTTCEFLAMGIPVIALIGTQHRSRVTYSILARVNLDVFAAESVEQYIDKAASWAGDVRALRHMRTDMRRRMSVSMLLDVKGYMKGLEDAYRAMWKAWCCNRAAA